MGNCIICGTPVDGFVCESHQEDVAFEFEGTSASQLVPNRYYRGSVDGYADFGLFVDIGDHVTGLLHRSELDRRLESLDLERGDDVYVQVLSVRDNGNVDLGWSIRQRDRDFRGRLIQTPDGDQLPADAGDTDAESTTQPTTNGGSSTEQPSPSTSSVETAPTAAETQRAQLKHEIANDSPLNRTTIDALSDQVGSVVRLEGEITGVRQTSGPTVFELSDETGIVECAAFEAAGVRAYPTVEVDDIVALEGEVERRHGDLQVETEALEVLDGEKRATVAERIDTAIEQEARPAAVEPLVDDDAIDAVSEQILDTATAIRRAVMEGRPIVVRHSATADGYTAGAALERAVLPLVREKHTRDDAVYHYFERRPLEGHVYEMDAATNDVTAMLTTRERHDEPLPLLLFVDAGSTTDSIDGYELLDLYGVERIVIDDRRADDAVLEAVSTAVAPSLAGVDSASVTSTTLAATVAVAVNEAVRTDLEHLPALSFWTDVPDAYAELAREAGYDESALAERREAVALEAYYQSYKDKRELVADLLFDDDGDLASHVSEQFRAKLETELETARENLETREVDGTTVTVLDTAAFTHRFDFPTTTLLLDELHRQLETSVTLGFDEDELHVRSVSSVDVRELADAVSTAVPDAGIRVVGGRDGYVEFLLGEREAVLEATLEALRDQLE